MTIKAILFDHDGTLVDSEASHFTMWESILAPYDISLTMEEYIHGYAGFPSTANAIKMIRCYPSLPVTSSDLVKEKSKATEEFLSENAFPLMRGARASVEYFASLGLKMAVVTGAGREGVTVSIRAHKFQNYFSTFVSSHDVTHSKPAPDCYLLAAKRLGLESTECIAIEDTESGVASAVAANVPCVAVSSSMPGQHDYSKAIAVFDCLKDATMWISKNYLQYKM